MSKTREFEIFNVSFLDLFACSIGVVMFIILIVFLNLTDLVGRAALPRDGRDAPDEESITREIERLRSSPLIAEEAALAAEIREARAALAEAEAAVEASEDLAAARRSNGELENRVAGAEAAASAERRRADAAVEAAGELERLLAAAMEAAGARPLTEMPFRIPVRRETRTQEAFAVECSSRMAYFHDPSNHHLVARFGRDENLSDGAVTVGWSNTEGGGFSWNIGELRDAARRAQLDQFRYALSFELKSNASGGMPADAAGAGLDLMRRLGGLNRDRDHISVVVRPSGIDAFRAWRNEAREREISVAFEIYREDERWGVGGQGGGGPAHVDD